MSVIKINAKTNFRFRELDVDKDYRVRQMPGLCSQCAHFRYCRQFVGAQAWWAECDWWPRRFVSITPPSYAELMASVEAEV